MDVSTFCPQENVNKLSWQRVDGGTREKERITPRARIPRLSAAKDDERMQIHTMEMREMPKTR